VAIVGAGLTGLWTAYYLRRADPALRIAVLEAEVAGFGASGRNGGWCSALFPTSWDRLVADSSEDGARRMHRAMQETVREVGRATEAEGIDADYHRGGTVTLARSRVQLQRLREGVSTAHARGFTEADERMHMIIRRTTVLIGADARVSTEDITGLLEGHDFTVLGMAADGRQIVDAARRLKPDVVVADASMSGLSAIELLHAFAAESLAARVIVLAMLYTATDGIILRHLITYNQNPYFPEQILIRLRYHCQYLVGPLLFAGLFPIALFRTLKTRVITRARIILRRTVFERCVLVVAVYFWLSTLLAAATISKQGASDNYFLEMDVVACWLSGLMVAWVARRATFKPRRAFVYLQMIVVFVLMVQCVSSFRNVAAIARSYQHPTVDRSHEVVNFIKQLPGDVYSEDMIILMQAGKEVPAEPAIISALAEDGKWDESGFIERIKKGQFSAVVIRWSLDNHQRFRAPIARAIEERYYRIDDFSPFKVYLPR